MPAKRKPRSFPSEDLSDTRPNKKLGGLSVPEALGLDMSPALGTTDLAELERIVDSSTPEQFQQAFAQVIRKMMVKGLREMPVPRSLKELQALFDMYRKSSGLEAKDKGGGPVVGGFLPRVVGRRALVVAEEVSPVEEAEAVGASIGVEPEPPPIEGLDAADPLSGFEV